MHYEKVYTRMRVVGLASLEDLMRSYCVMEGGSVNSEVKS